MDLFIGGTHTSLHWTKSKVHESLLLNLLLSCHFSTSDSKIFGQTYLWLKEFGSWSWEYVIMNYSPCFIPECLWALKNIDLIIIYIVDIISSSNSLDSMTFLLLMVSLLNFYKLKFNVWFDSYFVCSIDQKQLHGRNL